MRRRIFVVVLAIAASLCLTGIAAAADNATRPAPGLNGFSVVGFKEWCRGVQGTYTFYSGSQTIEGVGCSHSDKSFDFCQLDKDGKTTNCTTRQEELQRLPRHDKRAVAMQTVLAH